MHHRVRAACSLFSSLVFVALPACTPVPTALRQPAKGGDNIKAPPAPLTRLFFQDHKAAAIKWADVSVNAKGEPSLGPVSEVGGWKKLDAAKQKLVQMREAGGLVLVGVRDDKDGTLSSGWVLLSTGVGYADHGDHGHWGYKKKPEVLDSRLDKKQGNPAHVYVYGDRFFVANDKLDGYTRVEPAKYATNAGRKIGKDTPRFLKGGGGHITLAVVDDKVGYSCWIDGGGPNTGRVDVTPLDPKGKGEPAYSFKLPTGGIHGATANSGKVFFAPADGVCWVEADTAAKAKPDAVKVHHISLGKDGDKPRRTGAFVNHGRHVLLVTGREDTSALVLLDAKAAEPKPVSVPLKVKKGTRALTPFVGTTPEGKAYAFIFHDAVKGAEVADELSVVALDPNGDGDCKDAKVVKTMKVGKSAVDGHFGHHDMAFDADKRFAFFTNPGDGTICALSLKTHEVVATFEVNGTPTALLARGGAETDD